MDQATVQPVALLSAPVIVADVKVVEREVGYTIDDKYFKGFEVVKTANGWWKDRVKVEDFFKCIKQGYNQKQARIYVGITEQQLRDFRELHANFQLVIEHCEEVGRMMVESNIHGFLIDKDKETTRWYAERRIPEKYGRNLAMGEGGGMPVINNFGTIINTPAVKVPASVAERIKESE